MTGNASVAVCTILASLFCTVCLGAGVDLAGGWVLLQVYPQIAVLPLAGEVTRTSYIVQWVDIEQEGAMLTMTDRYCFTIIDDGTPLVSTRIPDAFMASLEPTPRTATLEDRGDTIRFIQDPYLEVRGAVLEKPESDSLPTNSSDPRVIDQDEDGNPGMTVSVSILGFIEGQTYIVQRVRYVLSGEIVSPDRVEGIIEWSDEQTVLEATHPLLKIDTIGYPVPDSSQHIFVMLRGDKAWTCEWLREQWSDLFNLES
jgi:hypothetical protein